MKRSFSLDSWRVVPRCSADRFRASESIFLSWQSKEHVSYVKPVTVVCPFVQLWFDYFLQIYFLPQWRTEAETCTVLPRVSGHVAAQIWFEEHKQKVESATVALVIGRNKGWCELRGVLIFVAFLTSPVIIMHPTAFPNTTSAFSLHALFKRLWLHPLLAVSGPQKIFS